jgi:hypothetical protein
MVWATLWAIFSRTHNGLGHNFGNIFKNLSGHPGSDQKKLADENEIAKTLATRTHFSQQLGTKNTFFSWAAAAAGLPDYSKYNIPKREKIPIYHKLYQISIKHTKCQ